MNKDVFKKPEMKPEHKKAWAELIKGQQWSLPGHPDQDAYDDLKELGVTTPLVSASIPANMKDATPGTQFHRILVIGDSGTGKTHFTGTMPSPFIADFDRGVATLTGKDVAFRTYSMDDWSAFKQEVMLWRKGPQYGRETFVVDSLSMASEAALSSTITKNGRRGAQPTIADWGEAIREMKEILGYLTTLPCHVVVTAHNQLVRDEVLGDIQYLPLIYGKDLPHRLGIWFDEVYATTVASTLNGGQQKIEYRLQVKPDQRNKILKSRLNTDGKLFEQYETADFAALVAKASTPK